MTSKMFRSKIVSHWDSPFEYALHTFWEIRKLIFNFALYLEAWLILQIIFQFANSVQLIQSLHCVLGHIIGKHFEHEIVIIFLSVGENVFLGAQKNHLFESFLLSTNNFCFGWGERTEQEN